MRRKLGGVARCIASRAGTADWKTIQMRAPLPERDISRAAGTPGSMHEDLKASASSRQSASSKSMAGKRQVSSASKG
jgi:hypothetical protein